MTNEIDIDYKVVESVAKVYGTLSECAAVLGVSERMVTQRAATDPKFKEAWERGQELCKLDVRRTGFRHAKGFGPQAVTAWIHLSKHVLGWTEKSTVEHTGTIQHELLENQRASDLLTAGFDTRCLTTEEAIELQDLCEKLDEVGSLRDLDQFQRRRLLDLIDRGASTKVIEGEIIEVPQLPAPELTEENINADNTIVEAEPIGSSRPEDTNRTSTD